MAIITPEFTVSFPQVFEPKGMNGSQPKYSLVMLFDNDTDLSEMKKAAEEATKAKFPNGLPANFNNPFHDQENKADKYSGYVAGNIYVTTKSNDKPGLVDHNLQAIISPEDFYPGCRCVAQVNAYAYDNVIKGVAFGLQNIQKVGDGERLDNRASAKSVFSAVAKPASEGDDASSLFG